MWVSAAIFLLTWITWYVGVPCMLAGTWMVLRAFRDVEGRICFGGKRAEVFIVLAILLWVLLSGIGGFWYQSSDHPWRNQVFLNLVNYSWPVHDGEGHILCYFWGFWVLPALVAKLTGVYLAGYAMQVLWAAVGIWLGMRLIFNAVGEVKLRFLLIVVAFGGIEYFRCMIEEIWSPFGIGHTDYANYIMFDSHTGEQILYVFNQMFAGWTGTLMILYDKRPGRSALVLGCMAFSAPFPCLALLPVVLWQIVDDAFRSRRAADAISKVFSLWNVGTLAVFFPILYYISRTSSDFVFPLAALEIPEAWYWYGLVAVVVCTLGIWIPFIWNNIRKYPPFWILLAASVGGYFVQMSGNTDLAARIWIPMIYLLITEVCRISCEWRARESLWRSLFALALLVGFWTNLRFYALLAYRALTSPYNEYRREIFSDNIFDLGDNKFYCRDHFIGNVDEHEWIIRPLDNEPAH